MSEGLIGRCALAAVVLTLSVAGAQADVLNMPTGQTSLQTVVVGDSGNAADTAVMDNGSGRTGYGSVGYVYDMGKYDVTKASRQNNLTIF